MPESTVEVGGTAVVVGDGAEPGSDVFVGESEKTVGAGSSPTSGVQEGGTAVLEGGTCVVVGDTGVFVGGMGGAVGCSVLDGDLLGSGAGTNPGSTVAVSEGLTSTNTSNVSPGSIGKWTSDNLNDKTAPIKSPLPNPK